MHLSAFDRFAWAAGSIGQILLLGVLFVRRRGGLFPMFTIYIANQLITGSVLSFILSHRPVAVYQGWFWALGLVGEVIEILVVCELATHVFCPTGVWVRDVRRTVITLVGASAVIAFLLSWAAQPATPRPIETFVLRNNFFSSALMSELFVGMVVLSTTYGLPWKTHTARIAQGLGTFSIISMALNIVANFVGLSHQHHTYKELSRIRVGMYLACEAYWIVMLWAEAPAERELPEAMRIQIYTLQRQVENDLIRIRSWRKN
jgi:hypothetical protein